MKTPKDHLEALVNNRIALEYEYRRYVDFIEDHGADIVELLDAIRAQRAAFFTDDRIDADRRFRKAYAALTGTTP
jgi:hypothetical protein